jgi:hypothetical protein
MCTIDQADSGITPLSTWKSSPLLRFFTFSGSLKSLSRDTALVNHPHYEPDHNEMTRIYEKFAKLQQSQDLIAFYTGCAVLRVERAYGSAFGAGISAPEYKVLNPATRQRVTSIRLREEFVKKHGCMLPFIAISYSSQARAYRLMLIQEVREVAYKVNVTVPSRSVPEDDWWAVQPKKKLIVMG